MNGRTDWRVAVIAVLAVIAGALGYYRHAHPIQAREGAQSLPAIVSDAATGTTMTPARMRTIVDTTVKLMGIPVKSIANRHAADSSGRDMFESRIGVPASFDDLHFIDALSDSLRPFGITVAGAKSLKEKTTTIRISDRDRTGIYRCVLYRKELPH